MQNPLGPVAHGVVEAARDVGAVQAVAGVHLAERLQAGADDVGGCAMHVDEHRVVVGREAVVVDLDRLRVLARAGDRVDQPLVVHRRDLPVVRERRRHHRERSSTPRSRASRMVRSTRIGDIGCEGPKSYAVSDESKTTVAGPTHSMVARYSVRLPWPLCATPSTGTGGPPPDGGPPR
jgi:hypothetical protein